jgi:hypothetical protein
VVLGPEAPGTALEDVAVMEEPVKHGGNGGGVAEELAPIFDGTIRIVVTALSVGAASLALI